MKRWALVLVLPVLGLAAAALAPVQGAGDAVLAGSSCLKCHAGRPVVPSSFAANPHGALGCTDCHGEVTAGHRTGAVELEAPSCSGCHDVAGGKSSVHIEVGEDGTAPTAACLSCHDDVHNAPRAVSCESCHGDAAEALEGSEHWRPGRDGKPHNASCTDCHSDVHTILSASDPASSLGEVRVHEICARCHDDAQAPAHNPITGDTFVPVRSYLGSVHGTKLGKVPNVATCTDCHGHHGFRRILDPEGTLSRSHIIETCGKCHQGILEKFAKGVHGTILHLETEKIGAMTEEEYARFLEEVPYESRPPVCTSCHTSHSIAPAEHMGGFDEVKTLCVKCHATEVGELGDSIHKKVVDPETGATRDVRCQDCHLDYHENKDIRANDSVVGKRNIADVCARCHTEEVHVAETGDTFLPVESYKQSVHGRGVYMSGLYFSAGCVDCHGSHSIFPLADPRSSLHHENVADTCGNADCHVGIHDKFEKGTHGRLYLEEKKKYLSLDPGERGSFEFEGPVCINCHTSHAIKRISDQDFFRSTILECGKCHEFAMATYRRSNHGKYALLGSPDVAKCYDCHGDHINLTAAGPGAELTAEVLLERCRKCHRKATEEMVSYITHLSLSGGKSPGELLGTDLLEKEKARGKAVLRAVRLAMEMLLVSVFAFFWLHSLLWLVRGAVLRIRSREPIPLHRKTEYFQRIDATHRVLHLFVIVSFLGLALTGLPIKYPDHPWSATIFAFLDSMFQGNGGQVARLFHRVFAIITFGYLVTHLVVLGVRTLRTRHDEIMERFPPCPVDLDLPPEGRDLSWHAAWLAWWMPVLVFYVPFGIAAAAKDLLGREPSGEGLARRVLRKAFGPDSMLPRLQDLRDIVASFRWFLWLGPRPRWDRWTYWEKFDYWAVFWGVAIIGTSGLCIWFKEFFTSTLGLPGWAINVAMEIHSHEALLATAFIFSIHFFNTHLNPGKFPMDRVIFTGRINRHELEHERPLLYDRLKGSGGLDALRRPRAPRWVRILGAVFGAAAVVVGVALVVWIVRMEWSNVFHSL